MASRSYLSIIVLHVNGLNAPIKRQRVVEWIKKKKRPLYMLSRRDPSQNKDTYRLKVKGWKKIFHANRDQKKAGVAILISDKTDFEINVVKRDKHTTS